VCVCVYVEELHGLLEAREQECVRLRRELKELKSTISLRRLLTRGEISSEESRASGFVSHVQNKVFGGFSSSLEKPL